MTGGVSRGGHRREGGENDRWRASSIIRSIYSDGISELTAHISLCDESHLISDLILKQLTQKVAEMGTLVLPDQNDKIYSAWMFGSVIPQYKDCGQQL